MAPSGAKTPLGVVAITLIILGPTVGALVGYNVRRRHNKLAEPARVGALFWLDRDGFGAGIPLVTIRRAESLEYGVPLLGGRF